MNRWGYKNGIIYGLLLSCIGAFVMIPAVNGAQPGDSNVLSCFRSIIYCRLRLFITANCCKPFAILLGDPEKGSQIKFSWRYKLGTTIGPIVLLILFGQLQIWPELNAMIANGEISLSTIQMLYLAVGGLFLAAFYIFLKNFLREKTIQILLG